MKKLLTITLLFLLLNGCTSEPAYITDSSLNPDNSATLIIYTPDTAFNQQNFIKPVIFIDGKELGKVSIKEPLTLQLPAGLHNIAFRRSFLLMPMYEAGDIDINTQPRETYYIRYSFDFDDRSQAGDMPKSSGSSSFRLIDDDRGKKRE